MYSKLAGSRGVVLREIRGKLEAVFNFGGTVPARSLSLPSLFPPASLVMLGCLAFALIAGLIYSVLSPDVATMFALAIAPAATTRSLKVILGELKGIQDAHVGKAMDETTAAKFDALAQEAKAFQDAADRDAKIRELEAVDAKSRQVRSPIIPDAGQPDGEGDEVKSERAAGYMTLGDFVVAQKSLREFVAQGRPKAQAILARLQGPDRAGVLFGKSRGSQALIPLSAQEVKDMRQVSTLIEGKAVPTLGANVIEPTRLADLVRVDEHDTLRLRDVLDIGRTTSDAVRYTRLTGYTRAAATVAHSASKPQAALSMDAQTALVKTLAVWMPVEEQQLDDMPMLAGMINNELVYDLNKHIEELVMYGQGAGEDFDGIIPDSGVLDARTVVNDTLIDISRRMITDVRRAGYEPNGILVDPLDWETIVLEKGSDNRYVWVVVTEGDTSRLWATPVVETVAAEELGTGARNMVVGDWRRGATLWDRMDATLSVGWINDQFTKNQRTMLAELRAAFAVRRPLAFRKYETVAAGS